MIRRLETKKDELKKEKRIQFILAGVLVLILFGSVFGIVMNSFGGSSQDDELIYNGYSFKIESGFYTVEIGGAKFYFSENPKDVDLIEKEVNLNRFLSSYSGKNVYISSNDYLLSSEIIRNFNLYVLRIQGACKEGEVCVDENLPIKTCEDQLIVIKEAEENKIYEEENCVYIEGDIGDLLKLTDEFLLRQIGIK